MSTSNDYSTVVSGESVLLRTPLSALSTPFSPETVYILSIVETEAW